MERKSWRSRSCQLAEIFGNLSKNSLIVIYSTLMLTSILCRLDSQHQGKSITCKSKSTDTLVSGNKVLVSRGRSGELLRFTTDYSNFTLFPLSKVSVDFDSQVIDFPRCWLSNRHQIEVNMRVFRVNDNQ